MPPYPTLSSLPDDAIDAIVPKLQSAVDALVLLRAASEIAHVNVRGPMRVGLHARFGDLYDLADGHRDVLSERIWQLGELVLPSSEGTAPVTDPMGPALCKSVAALIGKTIGVLHVVRDEANMRDDFDTLDAVIDATRALEKIGADILSHLV